MVKARGGEFFDMLSVDSVNSSNYNTYFCDSNGGSNGNILAGGGPTVNGSGCGLSCASSGLGFDHTNPAYCARLAFWGEPSSVGGSEILS